MTRDSGVLTQLMATIEDRKANPTVRSYTSTLMAGGVERIGEKITEEAAEVVDAARQASNGQGRRQLIHEAADLIYHLLVMLGYRDVKLEEVESELAGRFGVSGLDEKASRDRKGPSWNE